MFSPRAKQCALAASASLVPNNLASLQAQDGTVYLGFVSNAAVWVTSCVPGKDDEHRNFCSFKQHAGANQVSFFELSNGTIVLAAVGIAEVRLLKLDGKVLLSYKMSKPDNHDELEPPQFRGICKIHSEQLVVGDSGGRLHIIDMQEMRPKAIVEARNKAGIQCLASDAKGQTIISGDLEGAVVVWDAKALKALKTLRFDNGSCNSLAVLDAHLIIAFQKGVISVFSLDTYARLVDINAHGRPAYGITVDAKRRLVGSVGLDSKAYVWYIPRLLCQDGSSSKIQTVFTATIKDRMLCGIAFADDWFRVTCFDSYKMVQFMRTDTSDKV
eukprot:TRINITY_DN7406_c0_g1_i3.p1 TRINITY_DN7406_c0_g1~~TRINITY_DN7406_c0_g1_i3.p1  ORF type:complete len:328 (+),score=60.43 TRINITY_DN7406_c0_g1_i3:69-1052(+)